MRVTIRRSMACAMFSLVAACTAYWNPAQEEANIISPGNFKAGAGEIYQVGVLPGKERSLYRLFLRMDKTGLQFVDVDKSTFLAGEFVELTNDGRVVRVSGTSINEATRKARQ